MRRALRIVHTSDVHLPPRSASDSDSSSIEETAFIQIVDHVLEEKADALLIAGDLFDSNRVGEDEFGFIETQLRRLSCPVALIPGNHDCFDEQSIYRRFDFRTVGPHVHPLTAEEGEIIRLPDLELTVWGKGLVEHEPANRPMAGLSDPDPGHWFVGMAHGFVVPDRRELRSSLITPDEIADSGLDYLALGHIHVFRDVSEGPTRACYPGAPRTAYGAQTVSFAMVSLDPLTGVAVEERNLD